LHTFAIQILIKKCKYMYNTDFSSSFSNSSRMDNATAQYMVDFTLPDSLTDDFISTIPHQRNIVNRLFSEGKLLNYALSLENSKLWAIFAARTESDLMDLVSLLPLSRYMRVRVSELTFYNSVSPNQPSFSVN
jgi:muconolactone delta-isomerase